MPRKSLERVCCVCLNTGQTVNRLSKKDENKVNLLTKLKSCVPEINWVTTYEICVPCTNLLNIVYDFRETCKKSDLIRSEKQELVKEEFKKENENLYKEINQEKDEIKFETTPTKDTEDIEDISDDNDDANDPRYSTESDTEDTKPNKKEKGKEKLEVQPKKRRKTLKFTCEICQANFPASTKLVVHCVKEHHMDAKDVKPFACERCPNRFSTSSNLLQHRKYHEGLRSSMCSYCGKGFITKTDLINHEKKHLNKREYKCESCGKSFNTHKDIRSHRLIVHTDSSKWKYCCEICNKPFPIKSNYDSHMRRHTGDKKFECHLCDKKFTTKCDLQRHTTSHSHVREHQCQHCDKEYKDERVLKVHMAKIHGIGLGKVKIPVRERKYACDFCPKAYFAKNKLTRHLYTHSGEKPFSCPMCDKKFNDKSYVKQHLRNTHNVDYSESLESELKIAYHMGP